MTAMTAIIRAARPKGTAKWLQAELGCSPRQSWRMIQTGRVPFKFRALLRDILDQAFEANRRVLEHHQAALKATEYAEMAAQNADRRAQADRADSETGDRSDRQAAAAPLKGGRR